MLEAEMKLKLLLENRPWEKEPNEEQWVDKKTGLLCRIRRHAEFSHLCGYVGVDSDHPKFGEGEDKLDLEVHGGLTYSNTEDDGIHWFGFDCAHAGDLSPGILIHLLETRILTEGYLNLRDETYRTWDYVKTETLRLAEQLGGLTKC
jgi:hypothetical protein